MHIENIIYFLKKHKYQKKNDIYIKNFNRNIKVKFFMLRSYLAIYNGKFFIPLYIKQSLQDYPFSSFVFTKSIYLKKIVTRYNKKKIKKK
jgi:ribosomal protein S19